MKSALQASLAIFLLGSVISGMAVQGVVGASQTVAAFTWNPCFACAVPGTAVFFNGNESLSSSGPIVSYLWNFGDGSPPVKTSDPAVSHIYFDFSGKWLATLKVTDSANGTDSVSHLVVFDAAPRFNFKPLNPAVGQQVVFNASDSLSLRGEIPGFEWSFGDGSMGTGKVVSHSYSSPGIYRVVLTLVLGEDRPSISKTVVVGTLSGLAVDVKTEKQFYLMGEPVQITVVLSNRGTTNVTLHFGSACQASFQVLDSTDVVVFDWLRHVACPLVMTEVTLGPGDSVPYNFTWDQKDDSDKQVPEGDYSVKGLITSFESTPTGSTKIIIGLLRVQIDIKPGNDLNRISVRSSGTVPVAILSSSTFDSRTVDIPTVRFGRTGTEAAPVSSTVTDVNGDGVLDLLLRFNIQDTGFRAGDTLGALTGRTLNGTSFVGTDHIHAFLPGDVNGDLKVDIIDAALLAYSYGSVNGSALWNVNADFDENNEIDIVDAAVLGANYGQQA